MRTVTSYLITIFAGMFWGYRLIGTLMASLGRSFGFTPMNQTIEIILLFVTLFTLVLVFRRKLLGGVLYFSTYLLYFGTDLYNNIANGTGDYATMLMSVIGLVLGTAVLGDLLLNNSRDAKRVGDKKTDWYYRNKDYDRKFDERADKNNYRTM